MENVVVHLCYVPTVERWETVQHLISDHTQAPPVDGPPVVLFTQDFRSQVLWCPTESGRSFTELEVLLAQAKVREYNVSSCIEKDVLGFEVTIDNVQAMEVAES